MTDVAAPLLSFKAGRVEYDEATHQATPKAGPGTIQVLKNPDDPMFCSFVWEPRTTKAKRVGTAAAAAAAPVAEREELLLFPGDAEWTHIKQCTTGRVFELKFKSSGQRHVFWMQAPADSPSSIAALSEEDQAISTQLKKLLEEEAVEDEEMGDAEPAALPNDAPDSAADTRQQLQQLLSRMQASRPQTSDTPILHISHAVSPAQMVEYIGSLPDSQLEPLLALIPEPLAHTRAELVRVVQSAQFAQGLSSLSSVLNQPGTGMVVASELEYPYTGEGVQGFLDGARQQAKKDQDEEQSEQPRQGRD